MSQQTKVLPITGDPEAVASLRKHLEREGVPVRIFDGPDELVDRYFVHETGVITDRQLHHFTRLINTRRRSARRCWWRWTIRTGRTST